VFCSTIFPKGFGGDAPVRFAWIAAAILGVSALLLVLFRFLTLGLRLTPAGSGSVAPSAPASSAPPPRADGRAIQSSAGDRVLLVMRIIIALLTIANLVVGIVQPPTNDTLHRMHERLMTILRWLGWS
jgi:hypothetical protein